MLGILTAVAMGFAFYKGVLKINLAKFFKYTGIILIIVAAGVLAYGVHDLQEAGILPGLNNLAFDVSDQIPPASVLGTLLKGTLNFSPATTVLEAVVWVAYVVPTMTLFLLRTRQPKPPRPPGRQPSRRRSPDRKAPPRDPTDHRSLRCGRADGDLRLQPDRVQRQVRAARAPAPSRSTPPPTPASSPPPRHPRATWRSR